MKSYGTRSSIYQVFHDVKRNLISWFHPTPLLLMNFEKKKEIGTDPEGQKGNMVEKGIQT